MITTMQQIADESGFSKTAVSMALNRNSNGHLPQETIDAILKTAFRLGYQHQKPVPIPNLTEAEKGWLAGIIDGEGCLTISVCPSNNHTTHRTEQLRPLVTVSMCHRPTIKRIGELFGLGSTNVEIRRRSNPKWNDIYKWYVSSRQAVAVVSIIRPYLVTKAEEADVILEFGNLPNLRTGRAGIPPELLAKRKELLARIRSLKAYSQTEHALQQASNHCAE